MNIHLFHATLFAGIAVCALCASCAHSDDYFIEHEDHNNEYNCLKIDVVDEIAENNTRASYEEFPSTTFETGDAIGVYVFDGSTYVGSNIKFTRQSDGSWTSASPVAYRPNSTYYAYFPYVDSPYVPSTSGTVDAIDTKFSQFIQDSNNIFLQTNQSSKASFTSSNLMIAKGVVTGTQTVKFTMQHKRGLVILIDALNSDVSPYTPYEMDGRKYLLVKPSTNVKVGTGMLSVNSGHYQYYIGKPYLTFCALESGRFTLTIGSAVSTSILSSVSYSIDNGKTWTKTNNVDNTTITITTPTITAGGNVRWKGMGTGMSVTINNNDRPSTSSIFSSTGRFNVEGNITSLLYGDEMAETPKLSGTYNFALLFYSNLTHVANTAKIVSAKNLTIPMKGMPSYGCYRMFQECTELVEAPPLPATSLGQQCYSSMFYGCTSLTTPPELPAKTLQTACYSAMFYGCTSLAAAPELPAKKLASQCYYQMFTNCSNLKYIKAAFTTKPTTSYTSNWVSGVASSGTFYKSSDATWNVTGVNGIPSGWTVNSY